MYNLKTKKEIYERTEKNIIDTLISDKVHELDIKEQYGAITNLMLNIFSEYYSKYTMFSENIVTPLAKNGFNNPLFKYNKTYSNVTVFIKYRTEVEKERKANLVKAIFTNAKIVPLKLNDDYYENFKETDWRVLITDDIELVEKLATGDIDHKEFIVPACGYNKPSPELVELIKQKSGILSLYKIED